ncbi:MAG: aldo/keto reductase [Haloferacaceae archaeon]
MEYVTVQGESVPALGLGTYQLRGEQCVRAVRTALSLGYRHIDTAEYYRNEAAIGRAIAESDVDREDLFLVTKVWRTNLAHDDVLRSAQESLRDLRTDYLDLLLVHWPSRTVPIEETMEAMNHLRRDGSVRHVGVSNFSVEQVREARDASEAPILADQVKYHPQTGQDDLLQFCLDEDVLLTAYSPLAKGSVTSDETLRDVGQRYGKSPAQVALRWLVQQPQVAAIPKASSEDHLRENLDVFDFELTEGEMETIFELHGGLLDRLRSRIGL